MILQCRRYGLLKPLVYLAVVMLALLLLPAGPAGAAAPAGKLVLAYGDSLTAGYQLRPGEGFPAQLQAELRRQGLAAVEVRNAGVSGDTTAQGRARLSWVLQSLPEKPDLVILALGANDMLRGQPPAQAKANLDSMLTELQRRGIAVLLAGMLAAPNFGADYVKEFNAIYPDLAKKHQVPLYPFFTAGVTGNPKLLLADGMHPNAEGAKRMAASLAPLVGRLLRQAP